MIEALREMYPLNEGTIDKVKEIASKKQAKKIGGVMVDSFTASAISQIYDKVNDANKKKMEKLPITKLANLAFKMMQKNEFVPEEVELDEGKMQDVWQKKNAKSLSVGSFELIRGKSGVHTIKQSGKVIGDFSYDDDADNFVANMKGMKGQWTGNDIDSLFTHLQKVHKEEVELDEGKQKPYVSSDSAGKHVMGASGKIVKSFKDMDSANAYLKKNYNELMKEVDLDEGKMSQLHQYIKDKKSPEEIAKLMKLDVKTIKALMNSHHPEEVEESKTTVPMSTKAGQSVKKGQVPKGMYGNAARDARRAMGRDPEMRQRPFSKDDSATDDDVKGASKNIMMQMRKAQSLNGRFDVEFADGKKVKIPAKMAIAVQQKYNKMRRPAEKEKFQAKVGKSYRDMLSALKEAVSPAQQAAIAISKKERGEKPKKESVLDRIDKKIKEKNDG